MKTRIISGLLMVPLLIILYLGGYVLAVACFLIGIIGVYEFYKGFMKMGVRPSVIIAFLSTAGLYYIHLFGKNNDLYMFWLFVTVLLCLLFLFKIDKRQLSDALATLGGILYVVYFSFHVVLVDSAGPMGILVWLIVFSAFGTDIAAYFTGMFLGKHKLCPKISPKKTIEGAIGGVLGSTVLCGAFGAIFAPWCLPHCFAIGAIGGVVSQFGDLTASTFKRKMGIKDYGNLIPGHGGVLDRFDSVLFTAPMVYYYIVLVII